MAARIRDDEPDVGAIGNSMRVDRDIPTLRQRVEDKLREAILDFTLKPGEKLIERSLCEMLGVSRTSVREALRHLEAEGLVETRPNHGRYVASTNPAEAASMYQVRAELEGLAVKLFTERASDGQIEELAAAVDHLERTVDSHEPLSMLRAKDNVYRIIFAACGNPVCAEMTRSLHARVSYLRALSLSSEGRLAKGRVELRRILSAIQRRDAEAARQACIDHVFSAGRSAREILERMAD